MQPGDIVPDFTATLDDGSTTTLAEMTAGRSAVFFFYPKAFTPGCTAEACHFRDLAGEFEAANAGRFGVSRDEVETQAEFRKEHGFDYPLIADTSGEIARIFGAKRPGGLWSRRRTYLVGPGRTFLGEVKSESNMEAHADDALKILANAG